MTLVIEPTTGWPLPNLPELWRYRELLGFLAWRDLKVRYAQTVLGIAWTILQPAALMAIFVYAFSRVGNVHTGSVPYPVFSLAGLVLWTYFAKGLAQAGDSLVANAQLLTKIYCPRILIPLASILAGVLDVALAVVFFLVFAAFYGFHPSWRLAFLPVFLLCAMAFATGLGLFLSALNVRYRDVRQALPFLISMMLFLSPIAYPISSRWFELNPFVAIASAWRWALVGTPLPSLESAAVGACIVLVLLALGVAYFSRVERRFADVA